MRPALATDYSVGDLASYEIAVFEAVSGGRLVGQPARFGFHQLGPAHFWAQAPLYALSGRQRYALSLTALLLNWASFLALLYALGRWSESAGAALTLPVLATGFLGYYESATLFNYWPQYQNVLPFAVLVALAAAVATHRSGAWPLLLALASFVVQGYGSLLPATAAVLAAAAVIGRLRRRETEPQPRRLRIARWAASLAVLALMWTPTLLDELRNDPGNLSRMLTHYRGDARWDPPGLEGTAAAIAPHLVAPWRHYRQGATVNTVADAAQRRALLVWSGGFLLLMIATTVAAARHHRDWTAALCSLLLVATGGALVSSRQVDGDIYPYIFFWLAGAATVATVAAIGFWLDEALGWFRVRLRAELPRPALAAAATVMAIALLLHPLRIPKLGDASVGELDRALALHLKDHGLAGRPVHLVSHDFAWVWSLSMLLELAKRDAPVSIVQVQGTVEINELQGLMPRWLERRPAAVEAHLFDRDPGSVPGLVRVTCQKVLPFDPGKRVACLYAPERAGGATSG